MTYIAFARKYRPQTFDDIVGQPHVTTTLKNAISADRAAHAYLFAGPRGVGKTTAARILAKALNCEKGPSAKPCNTCAACKEITAGSSLDVLEIDGASNRGIDEIRNLRENVKFAPTKGKYKIYIIDEVHMLTPEAFNALLKTLEEPPKHVKFIFATTQAHKVPVTIISRCQRFDFRRIASRDVLENLKSIVKSEGLKIDEEALGLIAKYSDGGMRDAQVMLDQMTSTARSGGVKAGDVARLLGTMEDDALFEFSGSIRGKDAVRLLGAVDRLINEGKDVTQIALGLIEHFRNIAVAKISADAGAMIEGGPDKIDRYRDEAGEFTIENILYVIYTLSNAVDFIKKAALARAPLEAALIKLTIAQSVVPLDELMKRVEALEKNGPTAASPARPEPRTAPVAPAASVAPVAPAPAASRNAGSALLTVEDVMSEWNKVVNYVMPKKISIASCLQEGYPVSIEDKVLSIGFAREQQFHKDILESPENRAIIDEAVKAVLNPDLKVAFVLVEPVDMPKRRSNGPGGASTAGDADGGEVDPIVKAAMEIFGGDIAGKGRS